MNSNPHSQFQISNLNSSSKKNESVFSDFNGGIQQSSFGGEPVLKHLRYNYMQTDQEQSVTSNTSGSKQQMTSEGAQSSTQKGVSRESNFIKETIIRQQFIAAQGYQKEDIRQTQKQQDPDRQSQKLQQSSIQIDLVASMTKEMQEMKSLMQQLLQRMDLQEKTHSAEKKELNNKIQQITQEMFQIKSQSQRYSVAASTTTPSNKMEENKEQFYNDYNNKRTSLLDFKEVNQRTVPTILKNNIQQDNIQNEFNSESNNLFGQKHQQQRIYTQQEDHRNNNISSSWPNVQQTSMPEEFKKEKKQSKIQTQQKEDNSHRISQQEQHGNNQRKKQQSLINTQSDNNQRQNIRVIQDGEIIYKLGHRREYHKSKDRKVLVQICCKIGVHKDELFVHFREYTDYEDGHKMYPDKGMSFTEYSWDNFMKQVNNINQDIQIRKSNMGQQEDSFVSSAKSTTSEYEITPIIQQPVQQKQRQSGYRRGDNQAPQKKKQASDF